MADPRTPGPVGLGPLGRAPARPAAPTKVAKPGPIGVGVKKSAPPAAPAGTNLGAQVVSFAEGKSGKRVGDGQCFALVDEALKKAGAKSAEDFGTVVAGADYTWGTQVSLADVKAGDIVQFRDYLYARKEDREDGGGDDFNEGRLHHTAIVVSVDGNGLLTVIEQNSPKKSPVRKSQLGFLNTSFMKGKTSVEITVSGSFWFYRPQVH